MTCWFKRVSGRSLLLHNFRPLVLNGLHKAVGSAPTRPFALRRLSEISTERMQRVIDDSDKSV